MSRIMYFLLLGAVLRSPAPAWQTGTASVTGQVVDERGNGVEGATVTLARQAEYVRVQGQPVLKEAGSTRTATSGPRGAFSFEKLPGGVYSVCATSRSPSDLPECLWLPSPNFELRAGEAKQGISARVLAGRSVVVRFADRSARTSVPDEFGRVDESRKLFVSVAFSNSFRPMRRLARNATEQVFELLIPRSLPVRLFIDTPFPVLDDAGRAVQTGTNRGPVLLPANVDQVSAELRFTLP